MPQPTAKKTPGSRRKEPSGPIPPELQHLSMKQTERALGLSRSTIEKRMKDGTLPFIKIGGLIRFPASGVLAAVSPRKIGGHA